MFGRDPPTRADGWCICSLTVGACWMQSSGATGILLWKSAETALARLWTASHNPEARRGTIHRVT